MTEYELICLQQADREFFLNCSVFIITFISVLLIYLDYRNRKKRERAEKSIQIAEEFAKTIIASLSYIYAVFEKLKIDKIINKISFIRFNDFDLEELKELFDSTDIKKYQQLISEDDDRLENRKVIINTLNRLEYMCMNIATKVADDKYIYNSLHQQFFKAIALLYFEISLINTDIKDKYYTNIIHVYNLWKKKYLKAVKEEKRIIKTQKKLKTKLLPKTHKI